MGTDQKIDNKNSLSILETILYESLYITANNSILR